MFDQFSTATHHLYTRIWMKRLLCENSPDFVFVELLDIVGLVGHQEQEGVALLASTSCATHTMNVVNRCPRRRILHDPVHMRKVKSS